MRSQLGAFAGFPAQREPRHNARPSGLGIAWCRRRVSNSRPP